MYKVIYPFSDLQDENHAYCVGDSFPRDGKEVSEQRLQELSGEQNKQRRPLIQISEKDAKQEQTEYSKTDINRMPVAQLREMAKNSGLDGADEMTGAELKKYLFDLFGL